ncbi:MAG: N-formylglutamate deformylase [Rhodoferax sp.]|nr:N-formylglutamate deformylase [Rhodoferax sp.]
MNDAANPSTYFLRQGSSPLLVSMPHVGLEIPSELQAHYVPRALALEDTDWHLERLYDFAPHLGASVLSARMSRYVIDQNRPPDDAPMYPGTSNTELCPTRFFTGEPLYREGCTPDATERARRRSRYWEPYHQALQAELDRITAIHGYALLWDAHSIRSQIPWLFEGVLPDLNIGTAGGQSADPSIAQALLAVYASAPQTSHVLNGRFKGGFITRHYGAPGRHVHAVQLEMCQSLYMQETVPFDYAPALAQQIQPLLQAMLVAALKACKDLYASR